jgi:hypothetical protein
MNPSSVNGVIYSDISRPTGYSVVVQISLFNSFPQIVLALSQSNSDAVTTFPSYTCKTAVDLNA